MKNTEMKTVEVEIVAEERGKVEVAVPVNASKEDIEDAAVEAESNGNAYFFDRKVTRVINGKIDWKDLKTFKVGSIEYTISKSNDGQYCLSGDGGSETGSAEDIMILLANLFELKEIEIYRKVKCNYVAEDAAGRLEDREIEDPDGLIKQEVAECYVLDGEYDCTLDYWTNIDNLIDKTISK